MSQSPIKKKKKQKIFKYPKKKRTHYEAFGRVQEKNIFKKKKKNAPNSKNINLIKVDGKIKDLIKYDLNYIYTKINNNNNLITQDMPNLIKNQIYEVDFFNIIDITGDGNCLFRSISFYIYGSEYFYSDIRELTFKYIKNNITKFYEYCYIENGTYYINVEEGTIVRKFILDEYVSHIEEEGFFSGFIEINALSIIYNRPIVILDNLSYKNKIYFNKIAVFNNILQPIYNLEDIIFINFINKNHYQSLTLNKNFIIDRIKKNTYLKENIIIFNKKTNKIIRIESEKQDKSDNFINISDDTEEKKIEKEGKKNENIIHQNKKKH